MLWILASLGCCWLLIRELLSPFQNQRPQDIYWPYAVIVAALGIAFAWSPVSTWQFERSMERKASLLADGRPVKFHCNTLFDTMLDPHSLAAGHANPETGEIVFQKPWCSRLRAYLRDPDGADVLEWVSLNLFTHEAMHVRGEMNEAKTECQAVQRNAQAAQLLGVPADVARRSADRYYREVYPLRGQVGGLQGMYFSADCAPGKAWDEHLPDSPFSR